MSAKFRLVLVCVAAASLLLPCGAPRAASAEEWLEGVCRIRRAAGVGTGCVVACDRDSVWVLTNAHVAGPAGTEVQLEFWRGGHQSRPLAGRTVVSRLEPAAAFDVALVALPARLLGGRIPPVLPLAPADHPPGGEISTAGCAQGRWPSCVLGRLLPARSGEPVLRFVPQPAAGRSGSPLVDRRGRIVGLVAWRSGTGTADAAHASEGHGLAIPAARIRLALQPAATEFASTERPPARGLPISGAPAPLLRFPVGPFPSGRCVHGVPLTEPCRECQLCGPEGCFPFGRGGTPRGGEPAPANPWPTLPNEPPPPADLAGYVRRAEFEAARAALEDAHMRLERRVAELQGESLEQWQRVERTAQGEAAAQREQLAALHTEVREQERTLRGTLRDLVTSEQFARLREELRHDFLERLRLSAGSEEGLYERIKSAAVGAVEDRLAEARENPPPMKKEEGGLLLWALGIGLPLLGIGGWQAWLITRLAQRLGR